MEWSGKVVWETFDLFSAKRFDFTLTPLVIHGTPLSPTPTVARTIQRQGHYSAGALSMAIRTMTAELAAQVMSAPSFESVQELGEAWHTVAGYPRELLSDASIAIVSLLGGSFTRTLPTAVPILRLPCFFGPIKERLWDVVRREYCEPALAASARQRVRELSSYHWETLKLMFVGQRHPGQDPGCVFAQLDNDAIRIAAAIAMESLLRGEGDAVRNHSLAPWRGLLDELAAVRDGV